MFEPVREVPKGVTGLRATGTVIEQDVKEAVALAAAATQGSKSHGLVVFVGLDFDGYLAELVRGLKNEAAENSAQFARWALVVKDDLIEEKYRGIRPAAGYPSCPDHSEKATLWRLLDAEATVPIHLRAFRL